MYKGFERAKGPCIN